MMLVTQPPDPGQLDRLLLLLLVRLLIGYVVRRGLDEIRGRWVPVVMERSRSGGRVGLLLLLLDHMDGGVQRAGEQ